MVKCRDLCMLCTHDYNTTITLLMWTATCPSQWDFMNASILSDQCCARYDHYKQFYLKTDFKQVGMGYINCQPDNDEFSLTAMCRKSEGGPCDFLTNAKDAFSLDWAINSNQLNMWGQPFVATNDCYSLKFVLSLLSPPTSQYYAKCLYDLLPPQHEHDSTIDPRVFNTYHLFPPPAPTNSNLFDHSFGIEFECMDAHLIRPLLPYKFALGFGYSKHLTSKLAERSYFQSSVTTHCLIHQLHNIRDDSITVDDTTLFTAAAATTQGLFNGATLASPFLLHYIYGALIHHSQIVITDNSMLALHEPIKSTVDSISLQLVRASLRNTVFISFHSNPSSQLVYNFPTTKPMRVMHIDCYHDGHLHAYDNITCCIIGACNMMLLAFSKALQSLTQQPLPLPACVFNSDGFFLHTMILVKDSKFYTTFCDTAGLLNLNMHTLSHANHDPMLAECLGLHMTMYARNCAPVAGTDISRCLMVTGWRANLLAVKPSFLKPHRKLDINSLMNIPLTIVNSSTPSAPTPKFLSQGTNVCYCGKLNKITYLKSLRLQ
ncbi:LOW QUALITY PROTEIN: hypothetical protein HJC23_005472 [Cyclotella cryptica]|uniref:Uncharacterized protein n=1 Tax=Cyclotella cryptica TaxID=29204 RepID=A0ABD3PKI4_9STRA